MATGTSSTVAFRRELAGEIFIALTNDGQLTRDGLKECSKFSVELAEIITLGLRQLEEDEQSNG